MSVLLAVAPVAALSTAEAFVMIRGKFCDLSVGATASAAAVVAVWLSPHGALISLLGALCVGLAVGLVNGFAVGVLNGNAIIVTLGMASVVSALDLGISGGRNLSVSNGSLSKIGSSLVAGVPLPVIITVVVVVVASIWFSRARWGRQLVLAGDNERAALIAGVSVRRSTVFVFVLCGCFSAFGGYILATYVGNLNFTVEASAALPAIAGTVLGGISLFGGAGQPWHALLGAVLLGYFNTVLLVLGLSPYQEEIVEGLLVIAVVYLTERISFGRETRRATF
jgi:ribose/xylose/arabinose/galactoside ABC-type transport system permease subunit